ncbi:Hypothetical protein PENO1_098070 [Penicillium occitanis (nom. inval.)]|nr:Hypothetical protein PENO1_098070 [Penicillium occitanis (nom. inval.)]PCG91844.1 hypothetical protein PENOC_095490 [Penicillium occitanis (nom. inval.)]
MPRNQIVTFDTVEGSLGLRGLPILVDPNDYEGIHIASSNLALDLEKVTGHKSTVLTSIDDVSTPACGVILVGSIEKCRYFSALSTNILETLEGKWEHFTTSVCPSPWAWAEKLWYWWADVEIQHREQVYALPVTVQYGGPSIKYRGIFINDEAPALRDWVHEKFGSFNSDFYEKVYELLLRLKANLLWPAMWSGFPEPGQTFFTDDPLNHSIADKYGIVISTSHHEPMQRAMGEWRSNPIGEWNWDTNKPVIKKYFEKGIKRAEGFESAITLGMRGASDGVIEAVDPKATLRDVIATQRGIIEDCYGESQPRQIMVLYKEVLEYYEDGLEIPNDVTLVFPDDNFGNIRRLPSEKELARKGGSGIYYHLEYVGYPRSYKWTNTNTYGKIYEQLRSAYDGGASQLWMINVGDIKPLEVPLTFAMSLAWNIDSYNHTTIPDFLQDFSQHAFGAERAPEIGKLLLDHDRLIALRRHEHIDSTTFSLLNYREAELIMEQYHNLERRATTLNEAIPQSSKAAFFQLVLYPIKSSRIFLDLHTTLSKNQMYARQRRNTANKLAYRVLDLFESDWSLAEEYHNSPLFGDKWNHIMKQPHYGFSAPELGDYHTPSRDMISGLCFVQRRQNSSPIAGQMGVVVEGHEGVLPGLVNEECCLMQPSRGGRVMGVTLPILCPYGTQGRWFEVYAQGAQRVEWSVTAPETWVRFSKVSGVLAPGEVECERVEATIDWSAVPRGFEGVVHIDVRSQAGYFEQVHLPIANMRPPDNFSGFVESDGCIAIGAGAVPLSDQQTPFYQHLPYLGRTASGGVSLLAAPLEDMEVPYLEYPVYLFSSVTEVTIHLTFTMVLDTHPHDPLAYDIHFDGNLSQSGLRLIEPAESQGDLPQGWPSAVQDGVWTRQHTFAVTGAGPHMVKYRPLKRGLILEKVTIDAGGLRESYLGPPASTYVPGSSALGNEE